MNKQEAIELLRDVAKRACYRTGRRSIHIDEIVELVNQIDEPQKPVVPKFVAEWIEESKKCHNNLSWVWFSNQACDELNEWLKNHTETFMRAWLDGYTVEKEKLYTVEIPNPDNEYCMNVLIRLPSSGKIALVALHKPNTSYLKNKEYQLTESEIKQDFEWAFQFAKPVEE